MQKTNPVLKDVLATAAAPSSQRIAGWRTARYDRAKAALTRKMEREPSTPMKGMLDPKADIGPSPGKIPPLAAAVERTAARLHASGRRLKVRPVRTLPTDTLDYVIVGAGMAGIAAGAVLADAVRAGLTLKGLIIEGSGVVGGRARDITVRGLKAGLGPSWLHGRHNTLRRLADALGLTRERTYLGREVYIDGRRATKQQEAGLFREEERAEAAMARAATNGRESRGDSAAKFFPRSRWLGVAEAEMGAGDQGMRIRKVDAIDGGDFQSNQDDFIKEGMQEFVTRLANAAELPVSFGSHLKSARRGKDGIWSLSLKDGRTLRTKHVIYTGSTPTLLDVAFSPKLPRMKVEAAKALPMGNFTKCLFATKEKLNRPGTFRNSWVVDAETDRKTKRLGERVQFVVKYGGDPRVHIMFAAATVARSLLKLSARARIHYVEKRFEKIAGCPVHIEQMAITPFASEPLIKGSYSNLLPGMEGAHTVYAAPVNGLHFAGEAAGTAQNNASLLAAFTSGIDSAYDVIAALGLSSGKK